jgi:glycosyltransferase involved in cell wall biosynthesis
MRCPRLNELPPPPEGKTGRSWTEESPQLPDKMPDGSDWPKISIVTPNYNYGHFIEETIRSVLLQGYPNLEYIVIDGGSTDNSVEIIRKYQQYLTYWVSEPDYGQTDAINKGYQKCTGNIFGWLNADDAYTSSTCLKSVSGFYNQGYQLIVGECLNVDENDIPIEMMGFINGIAYAPQQNFEQYLRFWSFVPFPQPSVFLAKELTDKSFPLDKHLHITMDYQLFLRVLSQNPKSISVEQTWVKFKYHGKNKTMSLHGEQYFELFKTSLSEAKKTLNPLKMLEFSIAANDYLIIQSLVKIDLDPELGNVLTSLLFRPSLVCRTLFWKILVKSCLGGRRYSDCKYFIHSSIDQMKDSFFSFLKG